MSNEERVKGFYRKIIEYQVFYGWSVPKAFTETKEEMPGIECSSSISRVHRKLKEYEQQLYRHRLYAAIQKSKELIKYHVENGGE
ncbi:hypothetical protein Oweho_3249 [Owenweeksia hongkongensis DSM 17368]|uniref:Uncharacterized protein n=1 Tax=Owenweeksia hongkongensis (strain DSM 17368 / CIP 108786 / JCM 12287 / NRRL B-23963 / UST20020801) TaxID=926562 RepID=G8R4A0_OWEHD|nr:hypothetical protein [Owenweeksia hongkongensis]AEV34200.1 hypothetical protein Oweho_3249 [Owenweeksia hongkongensis DSM 17368]